MKTVSSLIIAVLICAAAAGQQKADLKLNLEKNKVYRLHSVSTQTIVQTVNGNQQTIESSAVYALSLKMVDATGSFMVTELYFDTIANKTNSMGKTVNMSSVSAGDVASKETSDIMSFFMNRLSKSPVYAKMDYTGKLVEIINGKALSDMILHDTVSITLTGPMASILKKQVLNMVSESSIRTMIEMFTHFLPGKETSIGDKWSITSPTNAGGMSLDILSEYSLERISGKLANIKADSNIKASANAAPMEMGGAKISYDDINGLSKSTLVIDTQTGLAVEITANTHITGNLGLNMPGMNMQIPIEITGESKVSGIQ